MDSVLYLDDLVDQVDWLDQVASTNHYLAQQPPSLGSRVVASWNQTQGVGRMGRAWVSPPGGSLALSVELGPSLMPVGHSDTWRGVLPLMVGSELLQAIGTISDDVSMKWPNDVHIGGKKVAGILGEIPSASRVIVGVGLNVWLEDDQLPTPQSTSLALHGLENPKQLETLIRTFLTGLITTLQNSRENVSPAIWESIRGALATLGCAVQVSYPDGRGLRGLAVDIDHAGCLLVKSENAETHTISAGDIEHLRGVS